jgi:hypothetical protein
MDMTVGNELPGGLSRRSEIQLVDDVVQSPFQQLEQGLPGISLYSLGFVEVPHKLSFEQSVVPLNLLLFAQADSVFAVPSSAPTVHAGREIPLFLLDRAFSHFAPDAFEHQLHAFATAVFTR